MAQAFPPTDPAYHEILAQLYARSHRGMRLGLDTMEALVAALGHPERALRCVLVAGTNGKGSTSAYLATMLTAAGHKVGLYTSPHLVDFTERIQIDGSPLPARDVAPLLASVDSAAARAQVTPSFFETATAMALLAFARAKVDWAVLEVGLGGRLDATNVVMPEVSVITPIGLDHTAILGPTLGHIAREKAGIMRPQVPVVLAPQAPEAQAALLACAEAAGAIVHEAVPLPPLAVPLGASLPLPQERAPDPALLARHGFPAYQRMNQASAAMAARLLGCSQHVIDAGIVGMRWPGRAQFMGTKPVMLLDGAHNEAALQTLLAAMAAIGWCGHDSWRVLFAALADKAANAMIALLAETFASLHVCGLQVPRGLDAQAVGALAPGATVHASPAAAVAALQASWAQDRRPVLVTGSLYLVGAVTQCLAGAEALKPVPLG